MDYKAAEGWFVNVWNYNVIPYLHQALRSGRKVLQNVHDSLFYKVGAVTVNYPLSSNSPVTLVPSTSPTNSDWFESNGLVTGHPAVEIPPYLKPKGVEGGEYQTTPPEEFG